MGYSKWLLLSSLLVADLHVSDVDPTPVCGAGPVLGHTTCQLRGGTYGCGRDQGGRGGAVGRV